MCGPSTGEGGLMPAILNAANDEEIHNLITWLDDHPEEFLPGESRAAHICVP
jgi:hypothetical protein